MQLDPFDFKLLIGVIGIMITAFSFIGGLGVKALFKMSDDISEIKKSMVVHEKNHESLRENHKALEKSHEKLEEKVEKIQMQIAINKG
jgi:hypothetical protein